MDVYKNKQIQDNSSDKKRLIFGPSHLEHCGNIVFLNFHILPNKYLTFFFTDIKTTKDFPEKNMTASFGFLVFFKLTFL